MNMEVKLFKVGVKYKDFEGTFKVKMITKNAIHICYYRGQNKHYYRSPKSGYPSFSRTMFEEELNKGLIVEVN